MKRFLTILGAAAVVAACSQSNGYQISGNLPAESEAEFVYLMSSNGDVLDSVAVNNGAFTLKGEVADVYSATVLDNKSTREATLRASVYLEPGKIALTAGENGRYTAAGTKANDARNAYSAAVAALDDDDDEGYYALINSSALENLDNYFGLEQLYNAIIYKSMDGEAALEAFNQLPANLKATKRGESVGKAAEAASKLGIGKPYLDFALANITDGKDLSLKSVVENPANKVVLLDFWASWCGPCMREVPFLLETYNQFHGKGFEIYGCSLDQKEDAWKNCVEENKMNWVHVSDVKYWECAGAELYGVKAIPANFLIDCATGNIIAMDLRGEKLAEKIAEILG